MNEIFLFILLTLLHFAPFLYSNPEMQYYSQCGQDQYVYENFFQNKKDGIFIDIGASDGIRFSNTYFFEKQLNWKGICIEPIPETFKNLQRARKAICIQGCISNASTNVSFLRVKGESPILEMFSGIIEKYDPQHYARVHQLINLEGGSYEIINVKSYNIMELLGEHNISHIDYLSLDTEGGELEILQSIDFNTITISVIDVENNYKSGDFKKFLEPLGYELAAILEQDEIYVKKFQEP